MASKIYLIDIKNNRYEFYNNGDIIINKKFIGKGRILTPIVNICLRRIVQFNLNGKNYNTKKLKGCMIDD